MIQDTLCSSIILIKSVLPFLSTEMDVLLTLNTWKIPSFLLINDRKLPQPLIQSFFVSPPTTVLPSSLYIYHHTEYQAFTTLVPVRLPPYQPSISSQSCFSKLSPFLPSSPFHSPKWSLSMSAMAALSSPRILSRLRRGTPSYLPSTLKATMW